MPEQNNNTSVYGTVPKNQEQEANSSKAIGQKVFPEMTKMVQEGNVKTSSIKPKD